MRLPQSPVGGQKPLFCSEKNPVNSVRPSYLSTSGGPTIKPSSSVLFFTVSDSYQYWFQAEAPVSLVCSQKAHDTLARHLFHGWAFPSFLRNVSGSLLQFRSCSRSSSPTLAGRPLGRHPGPSDLRHPGQAGPVQRLPRALASSGFELLAGRGYRRPWGR